jgi:DNA-binding GntR family transcriptional regulator
MSDEDRLYHSLKRAILEQQLPPGTRLRELELAELFAVKRGVVRTVLTRLAQERLVQQRPHAGARVACPDAAEAKDLFAARRVLETALLRQLAGALDAPSLQRLRRLLDDEQRAYREQRLHDGLRLSVRFHAELARLGGNRVLQAFIEQLLARTPLVLLGGGPSPASCVNHHHAAIVDALGQGDAEQAARLMTAHLDELEQRFLQQPEPLSGDLRRLLANHPGSEHASA